MASGGQPIRRLPFSNTFTGPGGTVTSRRLVASTEDYTATLTAILPEDPEVIYYTDDDGNAAGSLSSVAHHLGITGVATWWDLHWAGEEARADFAAVAGPAAEGDYAGVQRRRVEDFPGYEALSHDYQAAGFAHCGDEAQVSGALAYGAAGVLIAAIEQVANIDPAAIRSGIAATAGYPGVVGSYGASTPGGTQYPSGRGWHCTGPVSGPWSVYIA